MPKLYVKLVKCTDLINADFVGKSDPYVIFEYKDRKKTSSTKKNNLNPVYNEKFRFYILNTETEEEVTNPLEKKKKKKKKKTVVLRRENKLKITVMDYDEFAKDDLLGFAEVNLMDLPFDKEVEKTIQLFNSKTQGTIFLKLRKTNHNCDHQKSVITELKSRCCGRFYSCPKCHDREAKKWPKPHKMKKVTRIKCLNCLIVQPFRKFCVSCDKTFSNSTCFRCKRYYDAVHARHCYICRKCFLSKEEIQNHDHFVFDCLKSESYQLIHKIRGEFLLKHTKFFDEKLIGKTIFRQIEWIFVFFEKRLAKSTIIQIKEVIQFLRTFQKKNQEFDMEILMFSTHLLKCVDAIETDINENMNVKRREFYLMKRRVLHKVHTISQLAKYKIEKKLIPDLKFSIKIRKRETPKPEEDEEVIDGDLNENETAIFKWKYEKYKVTEEFEDFFDELDIVTEPKYLLKKKLVKKFEELIASSKTLSKSSFSEIEEFYHKREVVLMTFVLDNIVRLVYSESNNLKKFKSHKMLETEKKVVECYKKIAGLDDIQMNLIIVRILFFNFNNDSLYLNFLIHKLGVLFRESKKEKIKKYFHVIGMKELVKFVTDKCVQIEFVRIMRTDFYNLDKMFQIFKKIEQIYNEIVQGKKLNFSEFISRYMKEVQIFKYYKNKIVVESKDKNLKEATFLDKSMLLILKYIGYLKSLESKKVRKRFNEKWFTDEEVKNRKFDSYFREEKNDVKNFLIEMSMNSRKHAKDLTIEFFRELLPNVFDLRKLLKFELNVYSSFYKPIMVCFNKNLRKRLEKWVNRSISLEKYESMSKKKLHSNYCLNVVEILFQPLDVIFEIDCISRETEGIQKSVLLEYFKIMGEVGKGYVTKLKGEIENELDKILNFKEKQVNFFNFIQEIKTTINQEFFTGEMNKKIDFKKIFMCCNNIQGCLKLTTDLFLDQEFEDILINSGIEFGDEHDSIGQVQYTLDIPDIKYTIDLFKQIRDETAEIIAEFIFLENYFFFQNAIMKKDSSYVGLITKFCEKLTKRFNIFSQKVYYRFFEKVLHFLYVLLMNEISDSLFQQPDFTRLENFIYFVEAIVNLLYANGSGLSLSFLNKQKKNFDKIVSFIQTPTEELQKIYEKKKSGKSAFYILQILKKKGNEQQKKMAKSVLPDAKKPESGDVIRETLEVKNLKLFVVLEKCKDLSAKDRTGFSDPYVVMTLKKQRKKSKMKKQTLNPVYDEEFIFNVEDTKTEKVHIEVFDFDMWSSDDFIGDCDVGLSDLPIGKKVSRDFELKEIVKKGKKDEKIIDAGVVTLNLKLASFN